MQFGGTRPDGFGWIVGAIAVTAAGAIGIALVGPIVSVAFFALAALVMLVQHPSIIPPLLLGGAILIMRPSILGSALSWLGLALLLVAAMIAFTADDTTKALAKESKPARSVIFWITASYVWLLTLSSAQGRDYGSLITGGTLSVGALVATAFIVADPRSRGLAAKVFVALIAAVCISYTLTALLWVATGFGSGRILALSIPGLFGVQHLYAPFTVTFSSLQVFGFTVPRFTGIAREPGWMALYAGIAYLLLPYVGWEKWRLRLPILLGLLGTLSTAGFAMFAVVLGLRFLLTGRARTGLGQYFRVVFGLGAMAGLVWAAYNAPVVGIGAKSTQNIISLTERSNATAAGLWALWNEPFSGGNGVQDIGAVNLVAAVAAYGLPFSIAIVLSVAMPWLWHRNKRHFLPFAALILGTLATSQPALDSTLVFCLVMLCAALSSESPRRPEKKLRNQKPASSTATAKWRETYIRSASQNGKSIYERRPDVGDLHTGPLRLSERAVRRGGDEHTVPVSPNSLSS